MQKLRSFLSSSNLKLAFRVVSVLVFIVLGFHMLLWNRIYPGVRVAGQDVSIKTQEEVETHAANLAKPEKIILSSGEKKYELSLQDLKVEYRNNKTAQRAFEVGRKADFIRSTQDKWRALTRGVNIPLSISLDSEVLDELVEKISGELNIQSVEPSVNIQRKLVVINPGKSGQEVKREELRERVFQTLSFVNNEEVAIPIEKVEPGLTKEEVKIVEERAAKLLGKQIQITFEREDFNYSDVNLVTILGHDESFVVQEKAHTLISDLAKGVNREPQSARFEFADERVREFTPAKAGIRVKEQEMVGKIAEALKNLVNTQDKVVKIELLVEATKPETENQDVNNLGINELIGRGESIYQGSIPSRIHNLSLAASRLNGVLIKPGEEFSFNKTVGDISLSTGYQQAYVIKEGKTILDDGGGVCQTSTTFFRAALNTGLPIIERHQHSYRVSYYEKGSKPGYDAAIYLPNIDLRIKNDTAAHILIQTKNDRQNSKLVFEFYGTSDGRQVELSNYRQWDARPAPPDLYQEDPTLPVGTTKQVERAVPGLKTAFDYKVTRNGEKIFEKTFYSNFRPWQAVYLRGTLGQ